MKVETLRIDGMQSHHCADRITKSLTMVTGISAAEVSVGFVTVGYEESLTSRNDIEKVITSLGYTIV